MKIWASTECHQPAYASVSRARRLVEAHLNEAFARSAFSDLDMTLRYVPIVMPVEFHDRYKERSKAQVDQSIYDCAPHLDYEVFVSGTITEQIREYLRGISLAVPHLHKFGFTPENLADFKEIIASAVDEVAKTP